MEKYQLLVKEIHVEAVIEDWLCNGKCDLNLRLAKTKGCRVIETTDTMYAARIVKYLRAAEKVNIVKQ